MFDKIVIITKKTALEELIERFNTVSQAKFYIEHSGQSFGEYDAAHNTYHAALAALKECLPAGVKTQFIDRGFLTNFLFGEKNLIITLGQDGLVVNAAKYLNGQPILAVNPDPSRIDGILLPFKLENVQGAISKLLANSAYNYEKISMAKALLDNGQELYAVNDFFVGPKSHTCLRYTLEHEGASEKQMSSGLIISTGAGSTGWLKAVATGAFGIAAGFAASGHGKTKTSGGAGPRAHMTTPFQTAFARGADELIFIVREPFESKTSRACMTFGKITPDSPLKIISHTPSGGVIFSDGIESDFLEFNSGRTAMISVAAKKVKLIRNHF